MARRCHNVAHEHHPDEARAAGDRASGPARARGAEAAAARRKRRTYQLLAALGAALVVVVVAVLVSTSGGGGKTKNASSGGGLAGLSETKAMLAGLPQSGDTLGKPNAPVTIYEFADLQCPFCAEFAKNNLPLLVRDYVATGKAKLVYQDMAFIGPDSETAAAAAEAAAQQDKLRYFTNLFYWNQGEENSGYVTDAFIAKLYGAIPGLDVAKAEAARKRAPATNAFDEPRALSKQYGVSTDADLRRRPDRGDAEDAQRLRLRLRLDQEGARPDRRRGPADLRSARSWWIAGARGRPLPARAASPVHPLAQETHVR